MESAERSLKRVSRFIDKVKMVGFDDCWEWDAYRRRDGYGVFRTAKGLEYAHRVAYELWVAPIPAGLVLDHLCRNRGCVNPTHLEPVTLSENQRRGLLNQNAPKSECGTCGGPFDYEYVGTNGNRWRRCTPCNNRRRQEARAGLRSWASVR